MSFEGIPRPSQVNPYANPLSPYLAANEAASHLKSRPKIKDVKKHGGLTEQLTEVQRRDEDEDEDGREEFLSDEEKEQVEIFARLRGVVNLSLEKGKHYRFQFNDDTELIELVESDEERIVLTIRPEEFETLLQKLVRYVGFMADRKG